MESSSDPNMDSINPETSQNIIEFPIGNYRPTTTSKAHVATPVVDEMEASYRALDEVSTYKSEFDWEPLRKLEIRNHSNPMRAGFIFKSPLRLVNSHMSCQQCLYSFEVDTYGRGCVHNCLYCYAKTELTQHGAWNKPYPAPVDLNLLRKVFHTVFETDKKSKWREILEQKVPIRIGSMSDSFMWMDDKYKVTKEFLRILNHYNYPHLVFTRSDLIAKPDYMNLLRKDLCAIQFSLSSINDELNKKIEPGAPSAKRRLNALKTLSSEGFWTVARINPIFPMRPDGYFTDPNFAWTGEVPKFDYTTFEIVDALADTGTKAVLAGFGRFSGYALNQIETATGFSLRPFFRDEKENRKSTHDFNYSVREIRYYLEQFKNRCKEKNIQFTTCYIGNVEANFWKDQDLWSNKKDCCNVKMRVNAFKTDARQIPFSERVRLSSHKSAVPNDEKSLHAELGPKLSVSKSSSYKEDQPSV